MSEPIKKPRCPKCEIIGIEHIICEPSEQKNRVGDPWFEAAFCSNCGHVYGVFAKVVYGPSPSFARMPGL
ncbi:hypothetical protein [Atlantibacter sp.]|uniref:hypothetical protein n=1 Tax=Atlantibacter sp. TaxID=1903473 RepID=UPI0028A5C266|nr:hypothetical protein [Atlantibacter sp.]